MSKFAAKQLFSMTLKPSSDNDVLRIQAKAMWSELEDLMSEAEALRDDALNVLNGLSVTSSSEELSEFFTASSFLLGGIRMYQSKLGFYNTFKTKNEITADWEPGSNQSNV